MRELARRALPTLGLGVPVAVLSIVMAVVAMPAARAAGMSVGIAVAHLALAGRRVAPLPSFGIVCVGFAVQAQFSGLFVTLPSLLVFPVALYSVAVWGGRIGTWAAAGAGVVGAGVATWRLVTDTSVTAAGLRPDPVLVVSLLTAVAAVSLSLGLYRRTQLAYVAVLEEQARHADTRRAEQATAAVHRERQRIARDMHDVVSHSLAVIVSQAKGGLYKTDDPQRVGEVLSTIEETGRQALTDMRGLLGVLRPETTAPRGLRPQPGLRELPDLLRRARDAGLEITENVDGTARALGPAAELAVYRLVQESLTNVVKHGGTEPHAALQLCWAPDELIVSIGNRGTVPTETTGGHGLIGMHERLAAVGGTVTADPTEGGFSVTARLPYPEPSRQESVS